MSLTSYVTSLPARAPLHEPKARYRKRRVRRPAPGNAPQAAASAEPARPERPAHVEAAAARWQRITDLNARLSATLDGEGRALWLALEEALHVHWLDVAVDHYNRGYEAGRAQAWLDHGLAEQASPLHKLRALAVALQATLDRLDTPQPPEAPRKPGSNH